jgi:5-methylcytosine-specific restriction endonuclease McrA
MPRKISVWVGKTPDTKIPPRVRLRVWERGIGHCEECGRKIMAGETWELDHRQPLILGGEHHEFNLRVICLWCHRSKTRTEMAIKSVSYRIRAKHASIRRKGRPMPGSKGSGIRRRMDGSTWKE